MYEKTLVLRTNDGFSLFYDDRTDIYVQSQEHRDCLDELYVQMTPREVYAAILECAPRSGARDLIHINMGFLDRIGLIGKIEMCGK